MIQVANAAAADTAPPEWVRDELGGATGSGIRVAVLDSGWDRSLDDPRVLPGVGFVDPDDDFALARNDDDHDVLGHGTACADVILSVAPDARVVPVKVFGNKLETSPGTLEAALHWAIEAGVHVINVSLGTRLEGTLHPLYRACERARQAGIIVVAAGHNANDWSYPAIFENVIGVSAARFNSPYHFHYRAEHAMECVGWGVDRPVLWVGGERVVRHGTSFAAPGVAGIVALILERHPEAKLEDVRQMLARFAVPGGEEDTLPLMSMPEVMQTRETQPPKKPRKPKATSSRAADTAAPAKPAARPRKRAAAAAVDTAEAPAKKPRTRAAAPKAAAPRPADSAAPARKPRKPAPAKADVAPVADEQPKRRKSTAAAAKSSDAVPAEAPAKRRTARAASKSK